MDTLRNWRLVARSKAREHVSLPQDQVLIYTNTRGKIIENYTFWTLQLLPLFLKILSLPYTVFFYRNLQYHYKPKFYILQLFWLYRKDPEPFQHFNRRSFPFFTRRDSAESAFYGFSLDSLLEVSLSLKSFLSSTRLLMETLWTNKSYSHPSNLISRTNQPHYCLVIPEGT